MLTRSREVRDIMNQNTIFAACQIKINCSTSIRKYRSFYFYLQFYLCYSDVWPRLHEVHFNCSLLNLVNSNIFFNKATTLRDYYVCQRLILWPNYKEINWEKKNRTKSNYFARVLSLTFNPIYSIQITTYLFIFYFTVLTYFMDLIL